MSHNHNSTDTHSGPIAYVSTRGSAPSVDFTQALMSGLAPDGGLYVPQTISPIAKSASFANDYAHGVQDLLTQYGAGSLGHKALKAAGLATQSAFLGTKSEVPLVPIDDGIYL